MNQEDTYKLVQDYASRGVPLDVYVYDMDWHVKPQWGGYEWDTRLFPNPPDDIAWLHGQQLNALYMRGLEDVVMQQHIGVDAMWIDWQQGGTQGGLPNGQLNPTLVTNHVRGTSTMRRHENKRGFILARAPIRSFILLCVCTYVCLYVCTSVSVCL